MGRPASGDGEVAYAQDGELGRHFHACRVASKGGDRIIVGDDDQENVVVFGTDVVDLSGIDLAAVSELPSPVLRAAIRRVCEELSGNGDQSAVYAGFRSSLRATSLDNQGSAGGDEADGGTGRYAD
jgi:FXSXX-COOH protein